LSLPGGVSGDGDDGAGWFAADLTGVFLEEAVAVVADEAEFLMLVQVAGREHDCSDSLRAPRRALERRAVPSGVVGQVVQPPWVIRTSQVGHVVPPSVMKYFAKGMFANFSPSRWAKRTTEPRGR